MNKKQKVNQMAQALQQVTLQERSTTQRPEYSSWLQELRVKAREAEEEELAELEWLAARRAG